MTGTSLILGTAGHIDHGKTSLVRALTGVDTDRLAEEKKRGITIELGFARFAPTPESSFGVVDVPGHEGFVRTMVAGATGMDVVLMVVAADESVMPQTREHLAIVRLLGVEALVVALTKADLVEEDWLELVTEDVRELLKDTPYADAPIVPTSVTTGAGIAEVGEALLESAAPVGRRASDDLARLPADRVFTVEGAGTVVTGTLWSGSLRVGDTVTVLPTEDEARIRSLQVHGEEVDTAVAGQRTAVALTGTAVRRGLIERGHVLVTDPAWRPSHMLTVALEHLPESGWGIEDGQRVRVHLGTTEVMARVALLDESVEAGRGSLAQLRLEAPVVARRGDRFVVRSYSPMTTIAGGTVLEPSPPKRKRLSPEARRALMLLLDGDEIKAAVGAAELAGWEGLPAGEVAVRAGRGATPEAQLVDIGGVWFAPSVTEKGEALLLEAVGAHHEARPLESGMPLESLRKVLPPRSHRGLAEGLIRRLVEAGSLHVAGRYARLSGFVRSLTPGQETLRESLRALYREAGLQPPARDELPEELSGERELGAVLSLMTEEGELVPLGESFLIWSPSLEEAGRSVVEALGGREGLGPADFRDVLPVTRKHLIPLLSHFDTVGITLRQDGTRAVLRASTDEDPSEPGGV